MLVAHQSYQATSNLEDQGISVSLVPIEGFFYHCFFVLIQEGLPNKFDSINQQDTETLEDQDDVGRIISETEQARMVYLEVDDDTTGWTNGI
jgi:hypothetical protein